MYPNISVCRFAVGYATPDLQCCPAFSPKCGCAHFVLRSPELRHVLAHEGFDIDAMRVRKAKGIEEWN